MASANLSRTRAPFRRGFSWIALVAALTLPAAAGASEWATSIYSQNGVEIRVDERVFTLFAALNELGHDEAPITRTSPVPKREFHKVRQVVRDSVGLEPALRAKFEAFFDANPLPIRSYLTYVLALGPAPTFKLPEPAPAGLPPLQGLETLLAEFYGKARIQTIFQRLTETQRDAMRPFTAAVDGPIAESRKILKRPETDDSPMVIVVVNLLDSDGAAHGIAAGDETYLVVGPAGDPVDGSVIARAFARAELDGIAKGKGAALRNGAELFQETKDDVQAANLDELIAESLARAVAIRAAVPSERASGALDAEFRRGYLLVRELNRGLAIYARASKPLDAFVADFLREIDVARLLAAVKGS